MGQKPTTPLAALLDELCDTLGFCLPRAVYRQFEREGFTDVDALTDAIFLAEGLQPSLHRGLRRRVRAKVAHHFAQLRPEADDE